MGTHLRMLSKRYPMNTNMIGFRFSKIFILWTKVALALENLIEKPLCLCGSACINQRVQFHIQFSGIGLTVKSTEFSFYLKTKYSKNNKSS